MYCSEGTRLSRGGAARDLWDVERGCQGLLCQGQAKMCTWGHLCNAGGAGGGGGGRQGLLGSLGGLRHCSPCSLALWVRDQSSVGIPGTCWEPCWVH